MSWNKNQKIKFSYERHPNNNPIITNPTKKSWTASTNKGLKTKIKSHYSIVQDDKCAYCRMPVRYNGYGEPIEHIVPKSLKTKWMFHPLNLCLACYACNTKKSDKDTLINNTIHPNSYLSYPNTSNAFKIIHPHFDIHSRHIEEKNFVFKPKNNSQKGRNTIDFCVLNRFDLLYSRAKQKNTSNKALTQILTRITIDYSFSNEERSSAASMINKIIERYDYYKALLISNP